MTGVATPEAEASVGQRLLWLLARYRGSTVKVPLVWRISGPLDVEALQRALDDLVARHETLHTTYRFQNRRLLAAVHPPRRLPIDVADLTGHQDPEAAAERAMEAAVAADLDPGRWPAAARLWRLAPGDHLFLLDVHHLATDASSNRLLGRDLRALYDRASGRPVDLPAVRWQYAQWAAWHRGQLAGAELERLQGHWREELAGARPVELPHPAPAAAGDREGPSHERVDVEPALAEALREVGRRHRTTLFPVVLAVFYVHLHRRCGQRDLSVASLFANRRRPEVADTVGFFVNMLVLRVALDPDAGLGHLVRACRRTLLGALAHVDLPFQMLPPGITRGDGGGRIDDVVFQLVDSFGDEHTETGLDIDTVGLPLNAAGFALELSVVLNDDECFTNLVFDPRRYDRAWARRFLEDYVDLARALVARPDDPVARAAP